MTASGDLEHASATHRAVLLHAIAIGARPERVEAIVEALIAAVRAETQRETYAMAARIADFEGAHGVSNRIRALAVPK